MKNKCTHCEKLTCELTNRICTGIGWKKCYVYWEQRADNVGQDLGKIKFAIALIQTKTTLMDELDRHEFVAIAEAFGLRWARSFGQMLSKRKENKEEKQRRK